jgi:hypothetical protein
VPQSRYGVLGVLKIPLSIFRARNTRTLSQGVVMALARKTDKRTSKQAVPAKATLLTAKLALIEMAKLHPRSTANELALFCTHTFKGVMAETFRKRVGEAVAGGMLVECGTKMCSLTGKSATVYKVK